MAKAKAKVSQILSELEIEGYDKLLSDVAELKAKGFDLHGQIKEIRQQKDDLGGKLKSLKEQVETLTRKIGAAQMDINQLKTALAAENQKLVDAVARQTTIKDSVLALLNGQSAQLAALRQQVVDLTNAGIDASQIQPLLDNIDATVASGNQVQDALAAAVAANTPAQPGS